MWSVADIVKMDVVAELRPWQHYFLIYRRAAVVIARERGVQMTGLLYVSQYTRSVDVVKSESVVTLF